MPSRHSHHTLLKVGYKGQATALNRRVDCDVVVADVSLVMGGWLK
jgi:hypothetical protein